MDNNSNQLLGWEAVADVFSSNTIDNNPLVTGNLREEQGEISDEEIARLQIQLISFHSIYELINVLL